MITDRKHATKEHVTAMPADDKNVSLIQQKVSLLELYQNKLIDLQKNYYPLTK